ncbi:hypothetical protein CYLTODRAFT_420969 [Cylindrobasidium torrendii FP15055 ss-10]|uniref:Uncharacterized protein n=1 Tax=Cylindrobasidium torrendii FP15055 ss-10 TaxID=1314674 RepID=A0A0D7BF31_9AGAR|nr:hypothetical protein CYLTODRAFT_420969 [Cylindrobasidium torrendii FP15055 ss-10]
MPNSGVHFELPKPPADRPRKPAAVYPAVAQSKGSTGQRKDSHDLHWKWSTLSAASFELGDGEMESATAVKHALRGYHQSLVNHIESAASKLSSPPNGHHLQATEQSECSQVPSGYSGSSASYQASSSGSSAKSSSISEDHMRRA